MASAEVLDFAALLSQISDGSPAGADRKEDPAAGAAFRMIRDLRKQARDIEGLLAQGEDAGGRAPDWASVRSKAEEFLLAVAKDYDVTAWLIEALCRTDGFAGLRDGFRLARELAEKYWDELYPKPDEEGMVTRVAALTGLNGEDRDGTLIIPINNIPVTEGSLIFDRADYEAAKAIESITDPEKKQQRVDAGAVTLEMFNASVRETPGTFFRNLVEDAEAARKEFAGLAEALEARCGHGEDGTPLAPPTSNIRRAIDEVLEAIQTVGKEKLAATPVVGPGGGDDGGDGGGGGTRTGVGGGGGGAGTSGRGAWNREEALNRVLLVAEEFRIHEPQGLVAYALQQAVKWGRMSLPELLEQFVPEATARTKFEWLGIARPPESSEGGGS